MKWKMIFSCATILPLITILLVLLVYGALPSEYGPIIPLWGQLLTEIPVLIVPVYFSYLIAKRTPDKRFLNELALGVTAAIFCAFVVFTIGVVMAETVMNSSDAKGSNDFGQGIGILAAVVFLASPFAGILTGLASWLCGLIMDKKKSRHTIPPETLLE